MDLRDTEGRPQGATTGRYETVSGIVDKVAGREPKWKRWSDVPWWYRVLDRFGFPTLFALLLFLVVWNIGGRILDMWALQNAAVVSALSHQTEALRELADEVHQDFDQRSGGRR